MKCLIVAAGQGTRLREKGGLKPLVVLQGVSIIEHVIARATRAGITDFVVVVGYRKDDLCRELDTIAARQTVTITPVINDDWARANGVSLLKAQPYLNEPFLLTMCDHLADPMLYTGLIAVGTEPGTVTLAVDYHIDSLLNDPDDVTRVKCSNGLIERIGKSLTDFNAIDTGTFLCTTAMFDALVDSQAAGDDSISGAMTVLARQRRARVFDVQGRLWVDIDDPVAFAKAEALLTDGLL
jgi:1L-myo-inositol 1-phosphate cytidylyltransferase